MKRVKFILAMLVLFFISIVARSQDFALTNPQMVKLIGDTLNTKVLLVTFPPGVPTIVHTHPSSIVYVLEGGTIKVEYESGKTETITVTAGQSVQLPPDPPHKTTNTGTTPVKMILVEISR